MSRNPLGIFTGAEALHPVWAGDPTADRVAMSDFGDGYGDQYTGSVFPDRRNLNHVLAYVSAIGDDVNKGGAGLVWDSEIEYNVTAQTVFNGQIYVCVNSANKGHEPSLSSYYWSNLVDFLGIVQPKDDIKYIPFSSHSSYSLTCSSSANRTYSRSGFAGSGLVHDDIRAIHIQLYNSSTKASRKLYASMPNGALPLIMATINSNSKDRSHQFGVMQIPMNQNTLELRLNMSGGYSSFKYTILGATQRV